MSQRKQWPTVQAAEVPEHVSRQTIKKDNIAKFATEAGHGMSLLAKISAGGMMPKRPQAAVTHEGQGQRAVTSTQRTEDTEREREELKRETGGKQKTLLTMIAPPSGQDYRAVLKSRGAVTVGASVHHQQDTSTEQHTTTTSAQPIKILPPPTNTATVTPKRSVAKTGSAPTTPSAPIDYRAVLKKSTPDKTARDKEQLEKEKLEKERVDRENREREEQDKRAREEHERAEKERLDKQERERADREKHEREEKEKQEKERVERENKEREEKEKQERERIEREEQDKRAREEQERAEKECADKEMREREEQEKQERAEQDRRAREEQEQHDQAERVRVEREQQELRAAEELAKQREAETEQLQREEDEKRAALERKQQELRDEHEKERVEREEKEKHEREEKEKHEREEHDRLEKEKLEKERIEREEKEKQEREQSERARVEQEEKDKREKERIEREEKEKLEKERVAHEQEQARLTAEREAQEQKQRLEHQDKQHVSVATIEVPRGQSQSAVSTDEARARREAELAETQRIEEQIKLRAEQLKSQSPRRDNVPALNLGKSPVSPRSAVTKHSPREFKPVTPRSANILSRVNIFETLVKKASEEQLTALSPRKTSPRPTATATPRAPLNKAGSTFTNRPPTQGYRSIVTTPLAAPAVPVTNNSKDYMVPESTTGTYTYEELIHRPANLERSRLEAYLSDEDFERVFKVRREVFNAWPKWKQTKAKQELALF